MERSDLPPQLQRGETVLAKALALDPRDPDLLQALGELRLAGVRWKVARHRAQRQDFILAVQPFDLALSASGRSQEIPLALARLALLQAQWERDAKQNVATSLARGQGLLAGLLKLTPRWAEALALRGGLRLEEAEGASAEGRRGLAAQAQQDFNEAFSLNQHLIPEWKPQAERTRQLAGIGP
jgi:hypothetical protein